MKNKNETNILSFERQWSSEDVSSVSPASSGDFDLVCLSHLRWDFVYQRPQHLLSRCAKERRVFFIEEPIFDDGPARLEVSEREAGVVVVVPHLPTGEIGDVARAAMLQGLIDSLFEKHAINSYVLWYYTPMAMAFTRHLSPAAVVYDCMDELSAFKNAPPALKERELELFQRADLVFTGGRSLYEAKRHQHRRVYAFPSSIDVAHFAQAREIKEEPLDQAELAHPRLGFFGVIDERLDINLLDGLAEARPGWQLVMIGPIVKINPADLPRRPNIHYLGAKSYNELPAYLAGWDVALLLFARNESTRYISPTKTPEYLAAGRAVVSTSIRDVVRPYGERAMVRVADTVTDFVLAVEAAMKEDEGERLRQVDEFLAQTSWNQTWAGMSELIKEAVAARRVAAGQAAGAKALVSVAGAGL